MYVVLFDIDGTLLLTGGAGQLAFARTFAEDFGIDPISTQVAFAGRTDRAISLDLMAAHHVEPSEMNWSRFRRGYLARLPAALTEARGEVLPGVLALLDALGQREDVVVGLLTGNLQAGANLKLGHYDIGRRFAFGGFGDDATCRDEVAVTALAAGRSYINQSGCNGNAADVFGAMVIGDTVHDVSCARAINAFAVAVATGHTSIDELHGASPDLLLENLAEPEMLLNAIDARRTG